MKVLVTGVKGQLGYDVVKELEKRGMEAVGTDIEEEVKLYCKKSEVAGHLVYYMDAPEYVQGNFTYENNLYYVNAETKDDLFRIIENLKEIN